MDGSHTSRDEAHASSDYYATIDLRLVQLATGAASLFFVLLLGIWMRTRETDYLIQAIAPAAVASSGWVMLAYDRPIASLHLVIGALGLAVYVSAGEPSLPGDPLLALLVMTIVGAALVRTRIVSYSVLAASALGAAAFFWQMDGAAISGRLVESFTAIVAFAITVWLLRWQRAQSLQDREALRELVDTKDEFVATISHELRTPLTAVVGVAHELHGHYDDFTADELQELTSLLVTESRDIADIVEDLLIVARADLGNLTLDTKPTDAAVVALAVVGDLITPPVPIDTTEPLIVVADELRTRQIIRNLVGNAVRYGGEGIRLVLKPDSDMGVIEVRDNGSALSVHDRVEIFRAYNSSQTVAGKPGSMGLGLTVSRRLARLMDGDVTYDHDGLEAVFSLRLPLAPRETTVS